MKLKYTRMIPLNPPKGDLKEIVASQVFKAPLSPKGRLRTGVWGAICLLIFTFVILSPLSAAQYGKTILAMYKSSDGYSENDNPIKWYFEPEIIKMGLKIEYYKFESGTPKADLQNDVRAVLTWYNSAIVPDKKTGQDYIAFLNKAVDANCKIIIVNSFGVYGYKENGVEKWDLLNDINPLFKKLGFQFKGFWTDNPAKLRIVSKDSFIVEKDAKQDVNISRHYQQIVPIRNNVESYLTIQRTDNIQGAGDGYSSVILTSRNGGFAMEQFVLSRNKLMLNCPEFLRRAMFFDDGYQDVSVIIGDIKNKKFVSDNLKYTFKYAKIRNTIIDAEKIAPMIAEDLLPHNVIIIATDTTEKLPFDTISGYVNKGGRLVFAKSTDLTDQFMKLVGLKEYTHPRNFKDGFSVNPEFFMNGTPVTHKEIGIAVRKAELINSKVLGTVLSKEDIKKYPVLWETSHGKGKILYWNTDLLLNTDKGYRGTIVQSIQYIYNGFVTGMANIGLMMIDDLPAPLWNTNYREYRIEYYKNILKNETNPLQQEKYKTIIKNLRNYSNITDTNFISNTWIKDIEALEKQFGFKYSTYMIFNYNNKMVLEKNEDRYPIDDFYLAEGNTPVKMGNKVLDNGWELGFHGYNHQSLTTKKPEHYESLPWADRGSMVKALTSAKTEWITLYGENTLPFSYVAPHNIIDSFGLSAISEVFPSIKVLSTLYVSDQGEIEQEFEWTQDNRFFQIPRISAGYIMHPSNIANIYDAMHNFGVVSHFIHPDDVFDESRSSGYAGWEAMKSAFTGEFSQVRKCNPTIRWMTSKDAYSEFQFYNSAALTVKEKGKTIYVESSDGSERYLYFRMRLKKGQKIKSTHNCQIVNANYESGDVILKTTEHLSKIVLQ